MSAPALAADPSLVDSRTAWIRLAATLAIMTVGASGMYVVPVVLPSVQADFGISRADASLPYTLLMIGFGLGGLLMGRLADRRGVAVPLFVGAGGLGAGFVAAGLSDSLLGFALAHGLLIGLQRFHRGERLSAARFVQGHALDRLLELDALERWRLIAGT